MAAAGGGWEGCPPQLHNPVRIAHRTARRASRIRTGQVRVPFRLWRGRWRGGGHNRQRLRAFARFQLSVRLFPHCLDDIPAPSQIPGDLRKAVDVHPRQVPETLAAWRFRIQCCGSQDVRRRSRLPTPIELIDEAIPDLFSIRRARVHRGYHVARRPTVVAHGLTDSRTGSVREARTPCSSTTLTTPCTKWQPS